MRPAQRLDGIELSLIRQINALATPLSVNLGIGEPNIEPDETLREMARRATSVPWRYSPNPGHLSLRKKIAEGTSYDAKSEVCVTAGTEEALYAIFQAYVNPGDEVLVPNPGFISYATVAKLCGATPVPYDLEPPDWTLDVRKLRFTSKTKLVVVNSPSNPLGSVVDDKTLTAIARAAENHDALVVSDEVYRELWFESPPPSMSGRSPNAIVVNGMSKSHSMTGLRMGWILAREDVMKPIVTAHQYIATCASGFFAGARGDDPRQRAVERRVAGERPRPAAHTTRRRAALDRARAGGEDPAAGRAPSTRSSRCRRATR